MLCYILLSFFASVTALMEDRPQSASQSNALVQSRDVLKIFCTFEVP